MRKDWSHRHAHQHTDREHKLLSQSGQWLTPEAANRLAAFGIVDIYGMVTEPEIADAYRESHPVPTNDCEA